MKTKQHILIHVLVVFLISAACSSQTPWHTIGGGAAADTVEGYSLSSSFGGISSVETPDSLYYLSSGYFPGLNAMSNEDALVTINPERGWNLVALPLAMRNQKKDSVFRRAITPAYTYQNGYKIRDTLEFGKAYWVKFDTAQDVSLFGFSALIDSVDVNAKWNLVGSISTDIPKENVYPVGATIVSPFYGFSNSGGYQPADTLKPGKGYWVKVSSVGKLVFKISSFLEDTALSTATAANTPSSRVATSTTNKKESFHRLSLKDALGNERALYYSGEQSELDLQQYELPPIPPSGLDVRYSSGRFLEAQTEKKETQAFAIQIKNAKYPLTVSWEGTRMEQSSRLRMTREDGTSQELGLSEAGKLVIENDNHTLQLVLGEGGDELPTAFAVKQNYPNPFNPSTLIRYQLPHVGRNGVPTYHVTLKIYDVLGREVATLVDGMQEAGYKVQEWNASAAASGIYFYRVTALGSDGNGWNDVKKMMLVR